MKRPLQRSASGFGAYRMKISARIAQDAEENRPAIVGLLIECHQQLAVPSTRKLNISHRQKRLRGGMPRRRGLSRSKFISLRGCVACKMHSEPLQVLDTAVSTLPLPNVNIHSRAIDERGPEGSLLNKVFDGATKDAFTR